MSGKRYAILIASSKFPEEPGLTELRCPENDVDALNEILSLPELGGFEEPLVFKNAPSHEIMPQINRILLDADKDDLVLIYFSGHGKRNRPLHLHLATANTRISTLETTSIPAQMLGYLFEHSYSKRKILLLDCCRSGAVGKLFTKGGDDEELLRISEADGTFIMTACAAEQLAQEGQQHSVFTKHLVEGIRSGEADRNEDGWVDMDELFGYVRDRVRAEKNAQLPQSWHSHNGGELIISRSGMKSREKRTQEIKKILLEFVQEDKLTPGVALEAVQLLSISKRGMTEQEQACSLLIEQLVGAKISPPVFMEQWLRTCFAHVGKAAAPAPKKEIFVESAVAPEPQKSRTIGRYIDHGDGTITDTKTSLMWKRCLEGLSGVNCKDGEIEKYAWSEAVERFKNVAYAGYSDWRLPTIEQLETLVHCSKGRNNKNGFCNDGSEQPTINQQAFPNTEASRVWSGSPYADYSEFAWYVGFYNGLSNVSLRDFNYAVRLVRGGQ